MLEVSARPVFGSTRIIDPAATISSGIKPPRIAAARPANARALTKRRKHPLDARLFRSGMTCGPKLPPHNWRHEMRAGIQRLSPLPSPVDFLGWILAEVSRAFRVSVKDILNQDKFRHFVTARHVAYYLMAECSRASLPQIGRFMGRDHSTVLHGRDRIRRMVAAGEIPDPKIAIMGRGD